MPIEEEALLSRFCRGLGEAIGAGVFAFSLEPFLRSTSFGLVEVEVS